MVGCRSAGRKNREYMWYGKKRSACTAAGTGRSRKTVPAGALASSASAVRRNSRPLFSAHRSANPTVVHAVLAMRPTSTTAIAVFR
jgi:hypothetical protein